MTQHASLKLPHLDMRSDDAETIHLVFNRRILPDQILETITTMIASGEIEAPTRKESELASYLELVKHTLGSNDFYRSSLMRLNQRPEGTEITLYKTRAIGEQKEAERKAARGVKSTKPKAPKAKPVPQKNAAPHVDISAELIHNAVSYPQETLDAERADQQLSVEGDAHAPQEKGGELGPEYLHLGAMKDLPSENDLSLSEAPFRALVLTSTCIYQQMLAQEKVIAKKLTQDMAKIIRSGSVKAKERLASINNPTMEALIQGGALDVEEYLAFFEPPAGNVTTGNLASASPVRILVKALRSDPLLGTSVTEEELAALEQEIAINSDLRHINMMINDLAEMEPSSFVIVGDMAHFSTVDHETKESSAAAYPLADLKKDHIRKVIQNIIDVYGDINYLDLAKRYPEIKTAVHSLALLLATQGFNTLRDTQYAIDLLLEGRHIDFEKDVPKYGKDYPELRDILRTGAVKGRSDLDTKHPLVADASAGLENQMYELLEFIDKITNGKQTEHTRPLRDILDTVYSVYEDWRENQESAYPGESAENGRIRMYDGQDIGFDFNAIRAALASAEKAAAACDTVITHSFKTGTPVTTTAQDFRKLAVMLRTSLCNPLYRPSKCMEHRFAVEDDAAHSVFTVTRLPDNAYTVRIDPNRLANYLVQQQIDHPVPLSLDKPLEAVRGDYALRGRIKDHEFLEAQKKAAGLAEKAYVGLLSPRQIVAERQLLEELQQTILDAPGTTVCKLEDQKILRITNPMPELQSTLEDLAGPVLGLAGEVATLKQQFPAFSRIDKQKIDGKPTSITQVMPGVDLLVSKPDANGNHTLTFQNIKQIFRTGEAPLKYNSFILALKAEAGELTPPLVITMPKNQDLKIENIPPALKDVIADAFREAPAAALPAARNLR